MTYSNTMTNNNNWQAKHNGAFVITDETSRRFKRFFSRPHAPLAAARATETSAHARAFFAASLLNNRNAKATITAATTTTTAMSRALTT